MTRGVSIGDIIFIVETLALSYVTLRLYLLTLQFYSQSEWFMNPHVEEDYPLVHVSEDGIDLDVLEAAEAF